MVYPPDLLTHSVARLVIQTGQRCLARLFLAHSKNQTVTSKQKGTGFSGAFCICAKGYFISLVSTILRALTGQQA
jgi:hypothetical protein